MRYRKGQKYWFALNQMIKTVITRKFMHVISTQLSWHVHNLQWFHGPYKYTYIFTAQSHFRKFYIEHKKSLVTWALYLQQPSLLGPQAQISCTGESSPLLTGLLLACHNDPLHGQNQTSYCWQWLNSYPISAHCGTTLKEIAKEK